MLKAELTTHNPKIWKRFLIEVWQCEYIPAVCTAGLVVKLRKLGDLSLCFNWRGITLINTTNKIIPIIVHKRISNVLESSLRK